MSSLLDIANSVGNVSSNDNFDIELDCGLIVKFNNVKKAYDLDIMWGLKYPYSYIIRSCIGNYRAMVEAGKKSNTIRFSMLGLNDVFEVNVNGEYPDSGKHSYMDDFLYANSAYLYELTLSKICVEDGLLEQQVSNYFDNTNMLFVSINISDNGLSVQTGILDKNYTGSLYMDFFKGKGIGLMAIELLDSYITWNAKNTAIEFTYMPYELSSILHRKCTEKLREDIRSKVVKVCKQSEWIYDNIMYKIISDVGYGAVDRSSEFMCYDMGKYRSNNLSDDSL